MIVTNTFINSDIDERKDRQAEVHRKYILILQQSER